MKAIRHEGTTLVIEYQGRTISIDVPAFIKTNKVRTAASLETKANAWLANQADSGEVLQVHVYSLNPLDYAVGRFARVTADNPVPTAWWPEALA